MTVSEGREMPAFWLQWLHAELLFWGALGREGGLRAGDGGVII